jgi:hypothetical protein
MVVDRFIYRFLTYLAIGLAVVYLWEHSRPIEGAIREGVNNWWH